MYDYICNNLRGLIVMFVKIMRGLAWLQLMGQCSLPPLQCSLDMIYMEKQYLQMLWYTHIYPYFIISCLFDDLEFKLGG